MKIVPAGDRGLLVDLGEVSGSELNAAAAGVRRLNSVLACVPGHSSLFVIFDGLPSPDAVAEAIDAASSGKQPGAPREHAIRVVFDEESGPDLHELLQRVSREEFLARVATLRLEARYIGFRGGFAYLDGWPAEWSMPRRPTSRPRVPRGTFAVAAGVAAFYPIDSPGGWNLLGRTDADLENAIAPGDVIRIEPVTHLGFPRHANKPVDQKANECFQVLAGPLCRFVSSPDWAGLSRGVAAGGAFDEIAAAIANAAAGNDPNAALLECAMAGPRVRFLQSCVACWCTPNLRMEVREVAAGEELSFGRITNGLRAYLAAGSRRGPVAQMDRGDRLTVEAMAGPHSIELGRIECEVTPQIDRVGIRLRPLHRLDITAPTDLRSIGMQFGTVQLHPDGTLVAMGPDHPVTGGYLQPMTVPSTERWKLGQLVPGEKIVFVVRR